MDWVTQLISGIVITAALLYANKKSAQKIVRNKQGNFELKMNEMYKWIGWLSILIAVGVIILSIIFYEEGILPWVALIFLLFGGLGMPILMYYYNHQLTFDEENIVIQNWKGKESHIKWNEISQIKFSPIWGVLKIETEFEKLSVHQHLKGLIEFVNLMEIKTPYKAKDLKLPFISKQNGGFK